MLIRLGTRRRHGLAVLALVSLATIGACHESSTGPEDPQTYDLQARQTAMRSPSDVENGGAAQTRWTGMENEKATFLASALSSTLAAFGSALSTAARK